MLACSRVLFFNYFVRMMPTVNVSFSDQKSPWLGVANGSSCSWELRGGRQRLAFGLHGNFAPGAVESIYQEVARFLRFNTRCVLAYFVEKPSRVLALVSEQGNFGSAAPARRSLTWCAGGGGGRAPAMTILPRAWHFAKPRKVWLERKGGGQLSFRGAARP